MRRIWEAKNDERFGVSCAAENPAIVLRLHSSTLVGRVAELGLACLGRARSLDAFRTRMVDKVQGEILCWRRVLGLGLLQLIGNCFLRGGGKGEIPRTPAGSWQLPKKPAPETT